MIGCNPSTADDRTEDPTTRRLINMAEHQGYGRLFLGNLFAYRETNPALMKAQATAAGFDYVIGPNNELALGDLADQAVVVVFAYGNIAVNGWGSKERNQFAKDYARNVFNMMQEKKGIVYAFKLTKLENPQHPLFIQGLNYIPLEILTSV